MKRVIVEVSMGHKSFWHPYPHVDIMVKDARTGKVVKEEKIKLKIDGIPLDDRVRLSVSRAVEKFLNGIRRKYEIVDFRDYTGIFL